MTIYRFDQIAENIRVPIKPKPEDSSTYIGLEHLDSGSLRIRRWGAERALDGQKLTMKKGDVLFAKRNAYLRRVAVAPFDGVFSAHGMVLRAKEDVCLHEFLPVFMESDYFMERAIKISVGSLSPTINWSALAKEEFEIPPVDEQRRIADLIWAADDMVQQYRDLVSKTETLLNSKLREVMQSGKWKLEPLEKLASVERGKFAHRPRNLPKFYGGKYPFVQTGDIGRCRGNLTTYEQTLSEEGKAISKSFPPGSIIMTIAAIIGKTAITTFETWTTDSLVGIVPKNIDVNYLEFYLRTQQHHLESVVATQTAQKNINLADLRPMQIPVPPKEEQKEIANQLLEIQNSIELQEQHIEKSIELKKRLLTKMLSA